MIDGRTHESIDDRNLRKMNQHLTWCIFQWHNLFTLCSSEYRCWEFSSGGKIAYTEFYISALRVARWRL